MEKQRTAYLVIWRDNMIEADVVPVKILREGVLSGCLTTTMDIQYSSGELDVLQPEYIFDTEGEAWAFIKKWLQDNIAKKETQILILKDRLKVSQGYLEKVNMRLIKLAVKRVFT